MHLQPLFVPPCVLDDIYHARDKAGEPSKTTSEETMEIPKYKIALIVGAGSGLSASLTRLFSREGLRVALAARQIEKLGALCTETRAKAFACDATKPDEVERLFGLVERQIGLPAAVVYNATATPPAPSPHLHPPHAPPPL